MSSGYVDASDVERNSFFFFFVDMARSIMCVMVVTVNHRFWE